METLLRHNRVDSMSMTLGSMGHDCKHLINNIKEAKAALDAGFELKIKELLDPYA